jgi:hypothetical protein
MAELAACRLLLQEIYGPSYFGSGGGWGHVRCRYNCRIGGNADNGFMGGPQWVEVIDPTQPALFVAMGGDTIGRDGRHWAEAGQWLPHKGRWDPLDPEAVPRDVPAGTLLPPTITRQDKFCVLPEELWQELAQVVTAAGYAPKPGSLGNEFERMRVLLFTQQYLACPPALAIIAEFLHDHLNDAGVRYPVR